MPMWMVRRLTFLATIGVLMPFAAAGAVHASEPRLFEPGVISTTDNETAPTFSPNGRTLWFSRWRGDRSTILESHRRHCGWSEPAEVPFSGEWSDQEPVMSPDGRFLVFVSNRPKSAGGKVLDGDFDGHLTPGGGGNIWRVDRTREGWGAATRVPATVNSSDSTFGPSVTRDGSLYFMRPSTAPRHRFQIFRSQLVGGVYQEAVPVSFSDGSVTTVDPAVAPDESFIVFGGGFRPDRGLDLFIVFRSGSGWSGPVHLGDAVNSPGSEAETRLAPDGHTVYFSSQRTAPAPYERLNNGGYNVWFVDIRPWLRRRSSMSGLAAQAEVSKAGAWPTPLRRDIHRQQAGHRLALASRTQSRTRA